MKKSLLLSTALVFGSLTLAQAGGMAEPVMEPQTIEQQTTASGSHDFLAPLLFVLMAAAVASSGGSPPAVSDVRLKEDLHVVGMTPQGLPLCTWRYAGMPEKFAGVLAQDVAMIRPDALVELPFGFKAVDYGRLGLTLRRLN